MGTILSGGAAISEAPAWTTVRTRIEGSLSVVVKEVAFATGVSERDLLKQCWLHLPRFSPNEIDDLQRVRAEGERLAERLRKLRAPFEHWEHQPRIESLEKASLHFALCGDQVARVIHERFHYIGSFREGRHLGLFPSEGGDVPLALLTVSPMDIRILDRLYPTAEDRRRVLVVSRLFAFDWAPRNSVSYLMGQTFRWIHAELPFVDTLLTYLNPNLGFTGASYQASNWSKFVEVPARYAYLAGNYITGRTVLGLPVAMRKAVCYSQYELESLNILRYALSKRLHLDRAVMKRETLPCFH